MDSVLSDPALEASYTTDWTQWAGAIIGACLVGLTGVLPLWVIPAKALGTAPSAPAEDNLRYLLAFAGHSCIFLLPCMPVSDVDIQSFFLQLAVYLATFSFISSQKHINM